MDVVRAKVLTEQVGGKDSSTLLSTADDHLGVIFARCESSGVLMFPRGFSKSQCPATGARELRKNANPLGNWLKSNTTEHMTD